MRTGLAGDLLDKLLRAIADDRAIAILAAPDLGWLFCPHDGGMDIILPDADARDALRDRHSPWLSSDPSGLCASWRPLRRRSGPLHRGVDASVARGWSLESERRIDLEPVMVKEWGR